MLKLMEPSRSRVGCPYTTTSATICLGIENSASDRSPVIRANISSAVGPGIRKCIVWHSPTKVSDYSAPINSQCNSYLSRDFPINMRKPC